MGFVIKNEYGKYIKHDENGNLIKVKEESQAEVFESVGEAVAVCKLHIKIYTLFVHCAEKALLIHTL